MVLISIHIAESEFFWFVLFYVIDLLPKELVATNTRDDSEIPGIKP
jgi:hypothetical protein